MPIQYKILRTRYTIRRTTDRNTVTVACGAVEIEQSAHAVPFLLPTLSVSHTAGAPTQIETRHASREVSPDRLLSPHLCVLEPPGPRRSKPPPPWVDVGGTEVWLWASHVAISLLTALSDHSQAASLRAVHQTVVVLARCSCGVRWAMVGPHLPV